MTKSREFLEIETLCLKSERLIDVSLEDARKELRKARDLTSALTALHPDWRSAFELVANSSWRVSDAEVAEARRKSSKKRVA